MSDIYFNDTDIYRTEDNLGLLNRSFDDLDGSDFNQCIYEDEVRNKEITKALGEIELGEQFAFYKTNIKKLEEERLSKIKIKELQEIELYHSTINQLSGIIRFVLELGEEDSDLLTKTIKKQIEYIMDAEDSEDVRLVIKTRGAYRSDGCDYWHIDKDKNRQSEIVQDEKQEWRYKDRVHVIPLIGEGTEYRAIIEEEREVFYKVSNDTLSYYGHESAKACKAEDVITKLFSKNKEVLKVGDGGVHKLGIKGALHKAPSKSEEGRMILIITPIYKIKRR